MFFLVGILILGFFTYILNATNSGLWYDEAIEYFYSKYPVGGVPGGLGTTGMYERICSTYQPPLYNVLMYLWLLIFDGEMGFRLVGIVMTLLGAAGIFFTWDELMDDDKWASVGTLVYIYTSSIAYYALECAEYNLMICCIAWTVFFYVKSIKRLNISLIIGFFICACLSVYSQYGAVFIVIGMFTSLVIQVMNLKDKKMMMKVGIITIFVGIVAVLPLLYFFLISQMNHQGSMNINHLPVFVYNLFVDYIRGIIL